MADNNALLIEDRGPARIITINRPHVLNAPSPAVILELSQAFEALADAKPVRGVVLTGAGEKAFVAGADIEAMRDMSAFSGLFNSHDQSEGMTALIEKCTANFSGQ